MTQPGTPSPPLSFRPAGRRNDPSSDDAGNAALAACVIVLWSYAAEPFISTLSYSVYIYLPGGARELAGHVSAHHYIPPPLAGGLILAGYALAAALAAALTFTRRDLA